jgi:hypothetical protein
MAINTLVYRRTGSTQKAACVRSSLKVTPSMEAGIESQIWTIAA